MAEVKLIETREGQKANALKWKCYDMRQHLWMIRGRILEQQRVVMRAHIQHQRELDRLHWLNSEYKRTDAEMAEIDGRLTICKPKLERKRRAKKKGPTPAEIVKQLLELNISKDKLKELVREMED